MRMPISRARRVTVFALTPYSPTIASMVVRIPNSAMESCCLMPIRLHPTARQIASSLLLEAARADSQRR